MSHFISFSRSLSTMNLNAHFINSFQITAAGYNAKAMHANVKLAEAMGETSKTMGRMNKVMNPQKVAGTMRDFAMANERMNMTEETSEDPRLQKSICWK